MTYYEHEPVPTIFIGRWRDTNGVYRVRANKTGHLYAERYTGSWQGRRSRVADFKYEPGLINRLDKTNLEWMDPRSRVWIPGVDAAPHHLQRVEMITRGVGLPMPANPWTYDLR
jgi:hypothetical protein